MNTDICQRQRARRIRYRPAGETIATHLYEVARVPRWEAGLYVKGNHYSGSFCAELLSYGLFRRGGHLVGVAVVSQGMNDGALELIPEACGRRAELGRLVLDDDVPSNGESWFLARVFEELRRDGWAWLLSFSDPEPRRAITGEVVFPGHVGTIYAAMEAPYLGRSTARYHKVLPDGSILSPRSIQKIRGRERSAEEPMEALVRAACEAGLVIEPLREEADAEEARRWLAAVLPRITRSVYHPGTLRYVLPVDPRVVLALPPVLRLPYPTARLVDGALVIDDPALRRRRRAA